MRILFVVNDVDTEVDRAATTVLATAACRRGHDVFMLGVRELEYYEDGQVGGAARRGPGAEVESQQQFLDAVQGTDAPVEDVRAGGLDVIWLRYNPSEEVGERAWAQHAGILFGQVALEHGVVVLNHPYSLSWAINKMYFQQFPEAVRPACIITRSYERIRAFHETHDRRIVLKPLMGYGGADVFLVGEDADNLRQIVESVGRSSYVIAQAFLPAAAEGDTRLFLVNGKPLVVDGKYAAVRRVAGGGDFAGGAPSRPESQRRSEPQRSEAPRHEAPRTEAPRSEAPQSQAPRTEAPRFEAATLMPETKGHAKTNDVPGRSSAAAWLPEDADT